MKHITALLIKYAMITVVLEAVLLTITDLTFSEILYVSLVVTILAYIIGDLFILSSTNNTIATLADAGLALATIYMFNFLWEYREISFADALIAAAAVGVGEWFFHKYVANRVFPERRKE